MLFGDGDLEVEWAVQMEGDMSGVLLADWDGDGEKEIVSGSNGRNATNKGGADQASLQLMKLDGTPLYWHIWDEHRLSIPLAVLETPAGDPDEIVVGVGAPNGPEGRFSLPRGAHMHLYVLSGNRPS